MSVTIEINQTPILRPRSTEKLYNDDSGRGYWATEYCYDYDGRMRRIYVYFIGGQFFIKENGQNILLSKKNQGEIEEMIQRNNLYVEGRLTKGRRTKVLIIEGGGCFGIIPAYFLATAKAGGPGWLDEVDCLSGCSIGGILALAYACGNEPSKVLEIFKEKMESCFQKRFMSKINPFSNPTYSSEGIVAVLDTLLGEKELGEMRKNYLGLDIFIPALDITQNKYKVFDNIDFQDELVKCRDVALFTSAAPSYYEGVDWMGNCMIDGGLIEVAPLLTTVTGLSGKRGIPFSNMDVLMIGTGKKTDEKTLTTGEYNSLSLLGIVTDLLRPYTTKSNSLATAYWGKNMGLGSFDYFNPVPVNGEMDDVEDMRLALSKCPDYELEFLEHWSNWIKK